MITKLSTEEIVKGFISDYSAIKDEFKKVLSENGFRWDSSKSRENQFGKEGAWMNYISGQSIRIRWGKLTPRAIVYVEKEFAPFLLKFFISHKVVLGMKFPNMDYKTLNYTPKANLMEEEYHKEMKIMISWNGKTLHEITADWKTACQKGMLYLESLQCATEDDLVDED